MSELESGLAILGVRNWVLAAATRPAGGAAIFGGSVWGALCESDGKIRNLSVGCASYFGCCRAHQRTLDHDQDTSETLCFQGFMIHSVLVCSLRFSPLIVGVRGRDGGIPSPWGIDGIDRIGGKNARPAERVTSCSIRTDCSCSSPRRGGLMARQIALRQQGEAANFRALSRDHALGRTRSARQGPRRAA